MKMKRIERDNTERVISLAEYLACSSTSYWDIEKPAKPTRKWPVRKLAMIGLVLCVLFIIHILVSLWT